jgi:hypothetical protein
MTQYVDFIILKAETYEEDGEERFRFAATATGEDAPGVVFMFEDYNLVDIDGGIQAQCYVRFSEIRNGKTVLIEDDDPRRDMLYEMGEKILEKVTNSFFNELMQTTEKAGSLLDVSDCA